MDRALTFGVEFEFVLGIVKDEKNIPKTDFFKNRVAYIAPTDYDKVGERSSPEAPLHLRTVQWHIAQTLSKANFPISTRFPWQYKVKRWSVGTDLLDDPDWEHAWDWQWFQLEIVSPAYYYSEEALFHIRAWTQLITSTYCININKSSGLHVHVGNGRTGYNEPLIRSLHAFLWAFEDQLSTLHPEHRQVGNPWCMSLRDRSEWTREFELTRGDYNNEESEESEASNSTKDSKDTDDSGETSSKQSEELRKPSGTEGVMYFLRDCPNLGAVLRGGGCVAGGGRFGFYNFSNMRQVIINKRPEAKNTLEFRQHEATLDGDRVINWVRTVVGIVDFVRQSVLSPRNFARLMHVVAYEPYSKRSLAEHDFTVIDLLRSIGQSSAAEFYQKRGLHEVARLK